MNAIDIPAIRGTLGKLTFYTATFTFKQIAERVKPADDELHTSSSLREQLQRALTDNHKSITEYILTQKEHFFNALVLAIYDDGEERIFPVDGQHRVEGIKGALKENPKLKDEIITVIFIGHHNTREGKEKTRRIFSTLNRYAKPVSPGDIIALDEDDIVAITTRELLESHPLFMNDNVKVDKKSSKALADNDDKSFTSLITLYDTNRIIYTYYKSFFDKQKRIYNRPEQSQIDAFYSNLMDFWNLFTNTFPGVRSYVANSEIDGIASKYRNKETGGLLYFRPVALPQLIKAIFETKFRAGIELSDCMLKYAQLEMCISKGPWLNILWDNRLKTMIMKYKKIIFHILINMYDRSLLTDKEKDTLAKNYAEANEIDKKDAIIELNL